MEIGDYVSGEVSEGMAWSRNGLVKISHMVHWLSADERTCFVNAVSRARRIWLKKAGFMYVPTEELLRFFCKVLVAHGYTVIPPGGGGEV